MDELANQMIYPSNVFYAQNSNFSTDSSQCFDTGRADTPHQSNSNSQSFPNINNSSVIDAIRLMRRCEKGKRGPKEKDTFQRIMYCLPDKFSKLPKFSSYEESEKALIRSHQSIGYGFPAQDFHNGNPRKTRICLSYNASQFQEFIQTLFPNLSGRKWDIYKIDKQRRLLRVEYDTPRGIKDMKYQGSLIIIPYDEDGERPQPILYRTGEDFFIQAPCNSEPIVLEDTSMGPVTYVCHGELGMETSSLVSSISSPLTSPVSSPDTQSGAMRLPTVSSSSITDKDGEDSAVIIKEEPPCDSNPVRTFPANQSFLLQSHKNMPEPASHSSSQIYPVTNANFKIMGMAKACRNILQNVRTVRIRSEHLVVDVMKLYRENTGIINNHIQVFMSEESGQQGSDIPACTMFVMFWQLVFRQYFQGDREYVPVASMDTEEDLFVILGKILYHGLVLFDYWPVKLAQACTSVMFTDKCSDRQFTTSFYNVMSEFEKGIVTDAKKEAKSNMAAFSLPVVRNLCQVLRNYGNITKPNPASFEDLLLRLSRYYLVRRPYWALAGMKSGLISGFPETLPHVSESDVFTFYARLSPNALALFEKVNFIFTTMEVNPSTEMEEKRTKMYFEVTIMRMTISQMTRLLTKWCHFDCLCVDHLFTRFNADAVSEPPLFEPDIKTLTLSSVYSSQEEFTSLFTSQIYDSKT